jgi:very-short-patch-repair endonuclease
VDLPPIAATQAGAFTRVQAHEAGIARTTIRRRIDDGRWRLVVPGVLVARDALVSPYTSAWIGHLATGGVAALRTAGAIRGITAPSGSIHVITPRGIHASVPGITDHRIRLATDEVVVIGGLPVTTRERTVVDLLAHEPLSSARSLLFRGVQQDWVDQARLDHAISRRKGMHGTPQLRELVAMLGTGAHSVAERLLHAVLDAEPDLRYAANVPVVVGGSRFVVDVLLPDHGIVIEVDGRRFHSDEDRFTSDRARQNKLVGAGYVVLRFTWLQLVQEPEGVQQAIVAAVAVSHAAFSLRTGP